MRNLIIRKAVLAFVPNDLLTYHKNRKGSKNWDDYMTEVFAELKTCDEEKGIAKFFSKPK